MNPTSSKMSEVIFRMAGAMAKVAQDTENQELFGDVMKSVDEQTLDTRRPEGIPHAPECTPNDLQQRTLELLKGVTCDIFTDLKWVATVKAGSTVLLFAKFKTSDSKTGEVVTVTTRKYYISEHMIDSEIRQTAFLCLKTAQEHELRESFRYQGKALFGPHMDHEGLIKVQEEVRE